MKKIVKNLSKLFIATSLVSAVSVNPLNAQTIGDTLKASAIIPTTDTAFISKNIMDNMMEIQLSTLGVKNSSTPAIKKVSATMIKDHTMILASLKAAARKKGMSVPGNDQMMMSMSMPTPVPDLSSLTGAAFDKAYVTQMLLMHNNKVTELKSTINGPTIGPDVKALARTALAKIQVHTETLKGLSTMNP